MSTGTKADRALRQRKIDDAGLQGFQEEIAAIASAVQDHDPAYMDLADEIGEMVAYNAAKADADVVELSLDTKLLLIGIAYLAVEERRKWEPPF